MRPTAGAEEIGKEQGLLINRPSPIVVTWKVRRALAPEVRLGAARRRGLDDEVCIQAAFKVKATEAMVS